MVRAKHAGLGRQGSFEGHARREWPVKISLLLLQVVQPGRYPSLGRKLSQIARRVTRFSPNPSRSLRQTLRVKLVHG